MKLDENYKLQCCVLALEDWLWDVLSLQNDF